MLLADRGKDAKKKNRAVSNEIIRKTGINHRSPGRKEFQDRWKICDNSKCHGNSTECGKLGALDTLVGTI